MDRIQAAIARARAARDAVVGQSMAGPNPIAEQPVETAAQQTVEANWDAMPRVDISPRVLTAARIVTREAGPMTAPFDVLRTRVTQQMRANDWRRLCVTSPTADCGKSTVTLNLAFSLARQDELRILVVDFDLRRPALARMLQLEQDHQISRVLDGSAALANHVVRLSDNLAFSTAKQAVRNPAELLQGNRVEAVLDQIDTDYAPDVVLFDLPPVMVSDDAIGFLPHADCALMIAAAEQSTIKQVDSCEQELARQTNVLGVVLNKCDHPGGGYGYGYGSYG
ncbi:MAG: CpsD/CapB family tyrosine-protein kinase [Jannaschia sp.]